MLQVSDKVVRVCREESISQSELEYMLERAAMTSARGHNRRYFGWLFKVEGPKVTSMVTTASLETHADDVMYEEHEACGGKGCRDCGWLGEVGQVIRACN